MRLVHRVRAEASGLGRNQSALLFICVAAFLFLFEQGAVVNSDGASMLAVAQSLVLHHSFAVPASLGTMGADHYYYSKYGLGMSIVSLPAVALGRVLGRLIGHEIALTTFLAASIEPLILAGLAAALFRLARRLGAQHGWALVVAAGAITCTYVLPYGKDYFAEPLTALGITVAIERLLANRPAEAGVALTVAILTRPQSLFLVPIALGLLLLHRSYRRAIVFSVPVVVGVVLVAGYNLVRFGSPLESGYHGEGFTNPLAIGLTGLFLSPAKSLLLFAPVVLVIPVALVRLFRASSVAAWLILANFTGTLVIAATWFSWQGGWSWGPRLVLPGLLPGLAAIALLRRAWEKWTVVVLFVVGLAISASTLLVPVQAQQLDRPTPRDGPGIIRQYELLPGNLDYTSSHAFERQADQPGAHRRYVALWQVEVTRELGPRGVIVDVMITTLLLLVLAWSLRNLTRAAVAPRRSNLGRAHEEVQSLAGEA